MIKNDRYKTTPVGQERLRLTRQYPDRNGFMR